ncbi:MAG: hypothetical protein AABZ60_14670, partial [Planctomycetota bacterium]
TFFWFFYNSDIKAFFSSWKQKILLMCLLSLTGIFADFQDTILLLAHKRYEVRENAYKTLLEAGKINPDEVLALLKSWKKYPDPEIQWRVRKLSKTLQCYQSKKDLSSLNLRILELTRIGKLEAAEKLCQSFVKNYADEEEDDISFIHEQIASICYLNLSHKSDLESRYWDIGELALRYHHLYLYFFTRGEKIEILSTLALRYYEDRIQAGPMQRYDDHFKKIILYYSCLLFILGDRTKAKTFYEEYMEVEGNITPLDIAFYYTTINDHDKSFDYLLKSLDEQGYEAWLKFRNGYYFVTLQSDPRYALIYERKGEKEWEAYR